MTTKQPHLMVEDGEVNPTVLLPGDPGRVDAIAEHLDGVEELTHNREYKLVNGSYDGVPVAVCSTGVGCPSAAVAVEELANVGVETLIRVGTSGGLQPGIEVGDIVVATAAAKFEGTTKRYEGVEYPAAATTDVVNALVDEASETVDEVHVGPIVTDDAFYAEEEPASDWEEAGMLAVEMEAAVIFTLARRRNIEAGAVVTVDGNLVEGTQKGEGGIDADEDEELPEDAQEGVEKEIRIALGAAAEHAR
ncbi:MAG: nucleoside phosphorylase [Halobacteria archaeon]|nr:nucleoside phosphorylase [Halobacteria archaeon]